MFISLRNYLRIKNCLKPELHLNIRKNLVLTNIRKNALDAEHHERMNVYIKIDKTWIKQARESVKYYSLFNIIADKPYKIKTHLFLKNQIINIDSVE